MAFLVLNEQQVHQFKFYFDHEIHHGMWHNSVFYGLIRTYDTHKRLAAYDLASYLVTENCQTVITVSEKYTYNVWIRLTAHEYVYWRTRILNECVTTTTPKLTSKPQSSASTKPQAELDLTQLLCSASLALILA